MTRLIDADALLEKVNKIAVHYMIKGYITNIITNAPTVQREGWVSVEIMETDDGKWDATLKALWRRLQRNNLDGEFWNLSEIPEKEMYIFRAHFATALLASPIKDLKTSKPDINEMVNRFLGWKLPSDFSPDCGISFQGNKSDKVGFNPIGTNLFTATQAKSMIEHMLSSAPTDTE